MDLDDFQDTAYKTNATQDIDVLTLGLVGEAGSVATTMKKLKRDNRTPDAIKAELRTELGDVLWYTSAIAKYNGITLSEVAIENLKKTAFLFQSSDKDFDKKSPSDQKFPRKPVFTFAPNDSGKILITCNDKPFGDELDDNSHDDDGYRFHDVFHIAYMTKLGWSPVIRKQLGVKRKFDPKLDRVEDGARSIFLEEGISVFVFNQNMRQNGSISPFSDRGNIPFSIVAAIKTMTKGLEVECRSISDWFNAIADGFQMFDKLYSNDGGRILCDLDAKTMMYESLD